MSADLDKMAHYFTSESTLFAEVSDSGLQSPKGLR